jgi:hypothetical protein
VSAWLHEGAASRMVGRTVFNPRSSRSHAVAKLHFMGEIWGIYRFFWEIIFFLGICGFFWEIICFSGKLWRFLGNFRIFYRNYGVFLEIIDCFGEIMEFSGKL